MSDASPALPSQKLIDALRCPETGQLVALADTETLASINQQIRSGTLRTTAGAPRETPLQAALIREDQKRLYPIEDGFPIMLVDEAIDLDAVF